MRFDKTSVFGRMDYRRLSCAAAVLAATIALSVPFSGAAEETSEEARVREIVDRAYDFVKSRSGNMKAVQQALAKRPEFRDDSRRLYVFMHAYDVRKKQAVCVAQGIKPALIGKNMWGLRTPNGRLLFQEVTAAMAQLDELWIEYDWLNPYEDKIGRKRSLYKKVLLKDGRTAWIGCGYWKH